MELRSRESFEFVNMEGGVVHRYPEALIGGSSVGSQTQRLVYRFIHYIFLRKLRTKSKGKITIKVSSYEVRVLWNCLYDCWLSISS